MLQIFQSDQPFLRYSRKIIRINESFYTSNSNNPRTTQLSRKLKRTEIVENSICFLEQAVHLFGSVDHSRDMRQKPIVLDYFRVLISDLFAHPSAKNVLRWHKNESSYSSRPFGKELTIRAHQITSLSSPNIRLKIQKCYHLRTQTLHSKNQTIIEKAILSCSQ